MPIEPATYISSLNASNPEAGDSVSTADDHIRLIKSTVKATFPNVTGAVTATHAELNILDGVTASAAEINILAGATITTAELNFVDGVTSAIQTQLDAKESVKPTISNQTDSFNVAKNFHYVLTAGSSKTATFPSSASAGDTFWITNISGNSWTGGRNGLNIMGAASNDTLLTGTHYQYIYSDATSGWIRTRSS
jgi:hypothetical protein